jgi:hypothetical protein
MANSSSPSSAPDKCCPYRNVGFCGLNHAVDQTILESDFGQWIEAAIRPTVSLIALPEFSYAGLVVLE